MAARGSALSLVVHAVDGGGSVCGARPKEGRWRLSTRLPVNCARCLLALSTTRYAFCRIPAPSTRNDAVHIRVVGQRGIRPKNGSDTLTLCGKQPAFDITVVAKGADVSGEELCPRCRREFVIATNPALDPAHAVR